MSENRLHCLKVNNSTVRQNLIQSRRTRLQRPIFPGFLNHNRKLAHHLRFILMKISCHGGTRMKGKARRSENQMGDRFYWLCWAAIAGVIIYLSLRFAGVVWGAGPSAGESA